MSILVRIAWACIRPIVTRMLEAGASQESIWLAVRQQIANLNYIGNVADIQALLEKVAQELALHAGTIVTGIFTFTN